MFFILRFPDCTYCQIDRLVYSITSPVNVSINYWTHSQKEWVIQRIPGLSQLSPFDARSVEQTLIENYGLGKNGGILLNKINSIAATNPIYAEAVRRGQTILETIQFHNLR